MSTQTLTNGPDLGIDLTKLPALVDHKGVCTHLVPIGKTVLYQLASSGEIQSASIGMKRGKRVFVTASIVAWLQRRARTTKKPNVAGHTSAAATTR